MVGLVIHQWFPYFNRNIQYGFIYIYTYTYFINNPNTSKHHLANGRIWEYLGPVQLVHWSPGRIDNVSPKHEKVKHHTPTGTPPVTAAEFLPPFQRFVSLIQFVSVIWVNHVNRCKPSYIYIYIHIDYNILYTDTVYIMDVEKNRIGVQSRKWSTVMAGLPPPTEPPHLCWCPWDPTRSARERPSSPGAHGSERWLEWSNKSIEILKLVPLSPEISGLVQLGYWDGAIESCSLCESCFLSASCRRAWP